MTDLTPEELKAYRDRFVEPLLKTTPPQPDQPRMIEPR